MYITINRNGVKEHDGTISISVEDTIKIKREVIDYELVLTNFENGIEPQVTMSQKSHKVIEVKPMGFGDAFFYITDFSIIREIVDYRKKQILDRKFNLISLNKIIDQIDMENNFESMKRYRSEEMPVDEAAIPVTIEDYKALCELFVLTFPHYSELHIEEVERCYQDSFYSALFPVLSPIEHFSSETPQEYTSSLFGKYRKDLYKSMKSANYEKMNIALLFSGYIHDEKIIDFLENTKLDNYEHGIEDLGSFLKEVSHTSIIHLFEDIKTESVMCSLALKAWNAYEETDTAEIRKDFKTWEECYLYFLTTNAKCNNIKADIPDFLNFETFDSGLGKIKIRSLLSEMEIILEGARMGNCLKTKRKYIENTYSGNAYCFSVELPDETPLTIEVAVSPQVKIIQIETRDNNKLPKYMNEMISTGLLAKIEDTKSLRTERSVSIC